MVSFKTVFSPASTACDRLPVSQPNPSKVSALYPSKRFYFKRHEHLASHRDGLWRIQSGYVRTLTWDSEGAFVPLGFWQVGDVVGYAIAQSDPYKAQCLTPVTAEYLGSTYGFSQDMLLAQIQQSNKLLQISHCRHAEHRLLHFFCWIAAQFGQPLADGHFASQLKLTHQEIAESIGITRVTVTRLIKMLERQGTIKWGTQEKIVYKMAFEKCCINNHLGDIELTL
ncbi:MAG: Crp/Fnr family transcriptional regulator [Phormidesmis sp.]